MLNQVQHDETILQLIINQTSSCPDNYRGWFRISLNLAMKESYVYILSNKNRTVVYIGVTTNLIKRIENYKNGIGSKFTKKYNVNELLYFEVFTEINQAISREKQLKNWNSEWKWNLIKQKNPELIDLFINLTL